MVGSGIKVLQQGEYINPKICISTTECSTIKNQISIVVGAHKLSILIEEDLSIVHNHQEKEEDRYENLVHKEVISESAIQSDEDDITESVPENSEKWKGPEGEFMVEQGSWDKGSFDSSERNLDSGSTFTGAWYDLVWEEPLYREARTLDWNGGEEAGVQEVERGSVKSWWDHRAEMYSSDEGKSLSRSIVEFC